MANASYDFMWNEAIGDLNEQLHIEGAYDEEEVSQNGAGAPKVTEVTIFQAFQHFACLYIKYIEIFRKLEKCYDCMIHPQKRIHVKRVVELVIRRIIELKLDLVKWNPPNSFLQMPSGPEEAFPWEYINLDDILVDLKLSPQTLELPVPKYFREDHSRQLEQRDRLLSGYMKLKHGTSDIFIEDTFHSAMPLDEMTVEKAIEIIQRNERGRQGKERAILVKELREKERMGRMYDSSAQIDMDRDIAATNLQRTFKGFQARRAAKLERENELMFIGMSQRKDNINLLNHELNLAYLKRKQEQSENKELYEKSLEDMKEIILDEEGPDKRDEFREERTLWVTDQIAQSKFPEDLLDFYALKIPSDEKPEEVADAKADKGKKDAKGDKKEDKKGGKGGKNKGAADSKDEPAMPKLQEKTDTTNGMVNLVKEFESIWENKDESDNFQQKHDIELSKQVVRPNVYEEIRKQVDSMLVMNLKKIQMQIAPSGKKKKGKKGGKKKKKKGKKGKKDKKKKPLPGEKISELKGLDADHMLSVLIENNLVVKTSNKKVSDFIGEFNYLGSMHQHAERSDESKWVPQDPSLAQIRQSVVEYCILPNGSAEIKSSIAPEKFIKSVMFYGPSGSGKTMLVQAVANELGALLIHLTPAKLKGQFSGKTGPTKLVHMVMTVARDPTMQPCVIYIDECEQFFTGGKKNKDKDGPSRFKKDFTLYKNQALGPEHRVIIIGTSKSPENGDIKDLKGFFDRFLYFPYPDYSSRVLIWKHFISKQIEIAINKQIEEQRANGEKSQSNLANLAMIENITKSALNKVNLSSLAQVSEGYSAGFIARTVRTIVTDRRVQTINSRPLKNIDFLDNLAIQEVSYIDDKKAYLSFLKQISGFDERRNKIEDIISGAAAAGDDKKKPAGKKK